MLIPSGQNSNPRDERGAIMVLLAILLPLMLVLGSFVISVGSWYTHGRHLQTKVDAGAFAGGGRWGFPCGIDTDANIEVEARKYIGNHVMATGAPSPATSFNPQVGGIGGNKIFVTLNQAQWWDDNFSTFDFSDPLGSVCEAKILDVKATEDNSPPLWGWLPLWLDIKRKARIEIREAEGVSNILPIGVRVPKPVSAAAIFYNEENGDILDVRYFRETSSIFGLPSGLQGMTTLDTAGGNWASVNLGAKTGVAVGLSFRRACNTSPPALPPGMPTGPAPCFEDAGFTNIDGLCNQGANTQIVDCFYATGDWPSQTAQSGLHFIRGYPNGDAGAGPPQLRSAYLEDVPSSCIGTAYFNSEPINGCQASLHVDVDIGSVIEDFPPGPPDTPTQTRIASNVQVRYRLVREDGSSFCNYGANCDLTAGNPNAEGTVTFSTSGLPLAAMSRGNAIAIEISVRQSSVTPNPGNCGTALGNFNNNCRWFHTGNGESSTSTPPTNVQILAAPVQRAFMGALDTTGPVKWMRLTADRSCDGIGGAPDDDFVGRDAASQPAGTRCFYMEMGLKGGEAKDQDEVAFAFNEGTGPSQMGAVLCDPSIPDGQILIQGTVEGCKPWFAANGFDTNPLCPNKNVMFELPNPGSPFDGWPPIECVIRRATGSMNQLLTGLGQRILGGSASCPPDVPPGDPAFSWGRNYWHRNNNVYDLQNFANVDGSPPTGNNLNKADPRLVNLFFTPYNSFSTSSEKEYPIVALGAFYVTGWGRLLGNGNLQGGTPDDPCTGGNVGNPLDGLPFGQGNEPPPDLMACGGNCSGTVVWGHFIKGVVLPGAATPSGTLCDPVQSLQVCVPVLVE